MSDSFDFWGSYCSYSIRFNSDCDYSIINNYGPSSISYFNNYWPHLEKFEFYPRAVAFSPGNCANQNFAFWCCKIIYQKDRRTLFVLASKCSWACYTKKDVTMPYCAHLYIVLTGRVLEDSRFHVILCSDKDNMLTNLFNMLQVLYQLECSGYIMITAR